MIVVVVVVDGISDNGRHLAAVNWNIVHLCVCTCMRTCMCVVDHSTHGLVTSNTILQLRGPINFL